MTTQQAVRQRLRAAINNLFDIDLAYFTSEVPPRTELGDLAFPVAFELAKRLKAATGHKQTPREIASRLAGELKGLAGVTRVDVAGAGYLNIYLNRAAYLIQAWAEPERLEPLLGGKLIVEHTSINPNKAAHIGHLRNAVLGDTIVRILRSAGETVEVQNYIDNTGVQVADVVVGFKHLDEHKTLDQIKKLNSELRDLEFNDVSSPSLNLPRPRILPKRIIRRFDYHCWDLYARVGQFYEQDQSRLRFRTQVLHEIEAGEGEICEIADYISSRVLECHLQTMFRVGIEYDVMPRESDVLHLHIWERAFELLKQRGAVELETEGKLSGCWVMRAENDAKPQDDEASEYEADKVIVRSNGTVTYTGKDIAFHLWKLGQLDLDFYYKPFHTYADGHLAWVTTTEPSARHPAHARFGNGAAYFNVIDIGQSYPQRYVKLGVMAVDRDQRAERSAHVAYEKVVLTAAAVEELGQRLSDEDRGRGAIGMSGRKGLGIKIDDLINALEENALVEVCNRHPELSDAEQDDTAHKIAVGALRYFLLKYTRNSIISFDFKEALAMRGETGPYLQYTVARVNSVFRKLDEAGIDPSLNIKRVPSPRIAEILDGANGDGLWSLVYLASRFADIVRAAVASLEPALLAKWAFQLAQAFHSFYDDPDNRILSETDSGRRAVLIAITSIVRRQLVAALDVLGIEAPERM